MVTLASALLGYHTWFIDTGCTNYMYGKRELFSYLDESFRTKVIFADDTSIHVLKNGQILINLKSEDQKYISDVFYVRDMKKHLRSIGKLLEKRLRYKPS